MIDYLIMAVTTVGAIFILIAAVGVLRMPDFFLRLSVTVKSSTLGIGFIMFGTSLYFQEFPITTKVLAIVFFLFATAPVSGHMIGRTAYFTGMKLWKGTILDELKGKYDRKTHELTSKGQEKDKPEANITNPDSSHESPHQS